VNMGWPPDITWYKLLTEWGGLIAGCLGFVAAIVAVLVTIYGERRTAKRELASLRRALGVEVRLYTANALKAHYYCESLLINNESPIHFILIEDRAKFPSSSIYTNAVVKIGEFGDCAATLVRFFASIAVTREAADRLRGHPLADNLPSSEVAKAADGLIDIAKMGIELFPFLKTGIESEDSQDGDGTAKIERAYSHWRSNREKYFPFHS
jgi:hypothetical protein